MESLEDKVQEKINYGLLLLSTQERLSVKFVRLIRDGLFELRTEYNSNIYRVFFYLRRWTNCCVVQRISEKNKENTE